MRLPQLSPYLGWHKAKLYFKKDGWHILSSSKLSRGILWLALVFTDFTRYFKARASIIALLCIYVFSRYPQFVRHTFNLPNLVRVHFVLLLIFLALLKDWNFQSCFSYFYWPHFFKEFVLWKRKESVRFIVHKYQVASSKEKYANIYQVLRTIN